MVGGRGGMKWGLAFDTCGEFNGGARCLTGVEWEGVGSVSGVGCDVGRVLWGMGG